MKDSRDQLRGLSAHLQTVREEERTNIAREIHDELGQLLTVMKMDIALARKKLLSSKTDGSAEPVIADLIGMSELADQTIRSVRRIATELRPEILDELGIKEAIEWEAQMFESRTGIKNELISDVPEIDIDREKATAVFRIYQETLTNVARHANANRITTIMEVRNNHLIIVIKDNGRGITASELSGAKSLGLLGMRERALIFGGEVAIAGEAGKGTTVTVSLPVGKS